MFVPASYSDARRINTADEANRPVRPRIHTHIFILCVTWIPPFAMTCPSSRLHTSLAGFARSLHNPRGASLPEKPRHRDRSAQLLLGLAESKRLCHPFRFLEVHCQDRQYAFRPLFHLLVT